MRLEHLGIQLPIIQAPMAGGATTPAFVATMANLGVLGSYAAGYQSPERMRAEISAIRKLTDKPFAVNLFIPEPYQVDPIKLVKMQEILALISNRIGIQFERQNLLYNNYFSEQLNVLYEEKIPIVSFTFGCLDTEAVARFKQNHTTLMGTATSLAEAQYLAERDIDFIVAQGSQAGGHRGSFLPSLAPMQSLQELLPLLVAHIQKPIIAAGGIMTGGHIRSCLSQGAVAAQIGSLFLPCAESGIHSAYKERLLQLDANQTCFTKAYSGKWARGIENEFMRAMEHRDDCILDYPIQNTLTKSMREASAKVNNSEYMSLWAGENAHLAVKQKNRSAADIIAALIYEIKTS